MSGKLEEIQKTLGMLLEHSKHTNESIQRVEQKIDNHIGEENKVYEYAAQKVKHSENRLRIMTENAVEDCKERLVKAEANCAPAHLEKSVNGLYAFVALILIASVTFFLMTISKTNDTKAIPVVEKRDPQIEVVDSLDN